MIMNILSDLRLYRYLLITQIRAQAQYKMNLAIDISSYFAVTSLEFVGVLLYFGPFPTLLGWKVGEVAMLCAVMSMSFGLAEMFGAGMDAFPDTIRLGEFDRVLLRPVNSFILVAGSDFGEDHAGLYYLHHCFAPLARIELDGDEIVGAGDWNWQRCAPVYVCFVIGGNIVFLDD